MIKKFAIVLGVFCFLNFSLFSYAIEGEYHIGPGDVLEISVWKDESLSREIIVPPDLIIAFPLIGDVRIENMTVDELRSVVTKKLSEYVPDATVTVILHQVNSLTAYVIGKVNKPGMFSIGLETNVMQLLSMAGGLNPFASKGKIHVLRNANGENIKIPFDYGEVLKGENLDQNILLERGDVVVVP